MRLDKFSESLPFKAPLCPDNLFGHLIATAVPSVEEWRDGVYRRTLRLPFGCGIASLQPFPDHVACTVELSDRRDLASALGLCRFLLDLDADPFEIDGALSADPLLAPLVTRAPGPPAAPGTPPSPPPAPCWANRSRPRPRAPTPLVSLGVTAHRSATCSCSRWN